MTLFSFLVSAVAFRQGVHEDWHQLGHHPLSWLCTPATLFEALRLGGQGG